MNDIKQDDFKTIASWCLFDWANSAFTTLVVSFIYATYFAKALAPDEVTGTALWSRGITVSAILIGVLAPILGAAADKAGRRKRYLAITTVSAVLATALLAFVRPGLPNAIPLALVLFVVGNVGFELGMVFYNAFLPTIASSERIGRVSGYGWGVGYLGGLVSMVLALVGFVQPETPWFGISREAGFNIRATNLLVAGWFALFSLPLFLFVREKPVPGARFDLAGTLRELKDTVRHIRRYREIVKYLVAHLIYNDGLNTVYVFAGLYAVGTFHMDTSEVIMLGIMLNVVAGLSALGFGFVDDRIGGRKTLLITLAALSAAVVIAFWAPNKTWFWVAGVLVAAFGGPNQAASRSLMGRFSPVKHQSEFFGFYQLAGKATSFLGPMLLGAVTLAAGSQRAGVLTVVPFFLVGGLLLAWVNERVGIEAAAAADARAP